MRVEKEIAGHLKKEIAEEENAGAESVGRLAEFEVVKHLKLGEAYVDAVDPGDDPERREERDKAPGNFRIADVECGTCVSLTVAVPESMAIAEFSCPGTSLTRSAYAMSELAKAQFVAMH